MKMWWGPRLGRGDLFLAWLAITVGFPVTTYVLSGGFIAGRGYSVRTDFATKTIPSLWGFEPLVMSALALLFDLLLISLAYRRLQDANYPGLYAVAFLLLTFAMSMLGFVLLGFTVFAAGFISLFILKPTVGPNRFGPDPRGWKSPEHKQEQQERLDRGE